jgi:hypothetical protein
MLSSVTWPPKDGVSEEDAVKELIAGMVTVVMM